MYLSSNQSKGADPDPIFIFRNGDHNDVTALSSFQIEDKEVVISGSVDGKVQFWDFVSRRPLAEIQAGNRQSILFVNMLYVSNERILITQDRSGRILFWTANDIKCLDVKSIWLISGLGFCSIDIMQKRDCELLVVYPSEQSEVTVRIYEVTDSIPDIILKSNQERGMVMNIKINKHKINNVEFLIVGYEDGCLSLWDVQNETVLSTIKLFDDPIMAIGLDPTNAHLLVSSATNKLQVVNIIDLKDLALKQSIDVQFSGCSSITLRNDFKIVIVGGWDGKLRIFSWKKMKLLAVLKCHSETINTICFDKNNFILAGSKDGRISVWNLYANK